jgi:hypothetical protein
MLRIDANALDYVIGDGVPRHRDDALLLRLQGALGPGVAAPPLGLLGIYGAILLVAGIVASDADKEKAAGVNVNLWVGIALLLTSAVFWTWALTRPLSEELTESGER